VFWDVGSVEDNDAGGGERANEFPAEDGGVPRVRRAADCSRTDGRPRTPARGLSVKARSQRRN